MRKDINKQIQNILSEYKHAKEQDVQDEDMQEKSVINPELTIGQITNLKEKDLNVQVMISLIKIQEEIKAEEKKVNTKIKNIKNEIGSFRYEYDQDGTAINADKMQKMSQKFEKTRKQLSNIKESKLNCNNILSEFEEKTGLTTNNIKEMLKKQEIQKREYEEQEKIRKQQIEEKRKQEELSKIQEKELESEQQKNREDINNKFENNKEDIVVILPYQNIATYIFGGKEGQITNIRNFLEEDTSKKTLKRYKIKKEEYILTNNRTGETKEYASKLNPIIFNIFKSDPKELENYMNLKSKTPILYIFDNKQKENKDIAKIMYKYQKNDKAVSQKIGYIGFKDKINSRFSYKLGKKYLALPEGSSEEKEGLEKVSYKETRTKMEIFRSKIKETKSKSPIENEN